MPNASFDARAYVGQDWLGEPIDPLSDPWYRFSRLLEELERSVTVPSGARWLDLGCNQGQLVQMVMAKYGVEGFGTDDWDPGPTWNLKWRYQQSNLDRGFDLGRDFDFVSALEVLEHMVDTDAFLDRCAQHLVKSGRLLLTTPNINSLRNRVTVPLGVYPAGLEYRNHIHHVRLYNVPSLRRHLSEHGFTVEWIRGVNFLPMPVIKRQGGPGVDRPLANRFPELCGNVMVLARKT